MKYYLTIFLSAFLLFQIEPLISKYILPWFGGSPAVWTTAMLFFQVLLLAGYAYAHYLSRFPLRWQGQIHLAVAGIVLVWMAAMAFAWRTPITPGADWKPDGASFPVGRVLLVLSAAVGIPFFLLSTTSSLVQSWFGRMGRRASPYSFYVLSNAASLLALLSYPILFEPNWTVIQQAVFWSIGFFVYLLLLGFTATRLLKIHSDSQILETAPIVAEEASSAPPGLGTKLLWIALAALPSVMLLATTNQISRDIAPIPFLWVIPLSLYLLSFVIAFHDSQKRLRSAYLLLMLAALGTGLWVLTVGSWTSITFQILANAFLLFVTCMFCHNELYLRRPHPRHLTSFYLMLSIGGAVGGIFVNLIAPLIFRDYWEYHVALILCAGFLIAGIYQARGSWLFRWRVYVSVISLVLAVLILILPFEWAANSVAISRNFYGVIKIRETKLNNIPGYALVHGAIMHGFQATEAGMHNRPTTYYTEQGGAGLAILNDPRRKTGKPVRIGVVGLGVGTLAAYGRPGDTLRFYEIDPDVIRVAQDPRYFTFLKDSPAKVDIVLGDARLSLERELREGGSQNYDILVVDAFSGDSIPSHLISEEAVGLYLSHLKETGVLAFHITNRHVDLVPVLALVADQYELHGALIQSLEPGGLGSSSNWVLLAKNEKVLAAPAIAAASKPLEKKPGVRLWTDDFSNLFQVLK
jgi:hypothetical protein